MKFVFDVGHMMFELPVTARVILLYTSLCPVLLCKLLKKLQKVHNERESYTCIIIIMLSIVTLGT